MMIQVRSWIYLVAFLTWTVIAGIGLSPSLLKASWTMVTVRIWIGGIMVLAKYIVGITCRVKGHEHLPVDADGKVSACIIAAQHQSSFETYRLFLDLPHPIFILKRELIWIPLVGWYMKRAGFISIDRGAGAAAMRKMLRAAQAALDEGRQVIVFPEGTRVQPGQDRTYRPGIVAMYKNCTAPVVPMALNSGRLWGKTRVLKLPGEIVFQFLPALPTGLDKEGVLTELRTRLEAAEVLLPNS